MRRTMWSAVLTALCVGLTATAWAGPFNLVTNGSFEDPNIGNTTFITLNTNSTYLTGWTVTSGSVDLIRNYWTASDGAQSLDLSGNGPGTIASQNIATTPGTWYLLLFDMAGNPNGTPTTKTMDVLWNGTTVLQPSFSTTGHTRTNMGWQTFSVLVQATAASSTVSFKSTTSTAYGPALDNVRLYVPEGPSGLLLLPGLLPIAVLVRRRRS